MTKFDVTKFCDKDRNPIRPLFAGVCYRGGRVLASESHMAAFVTADYGPENENKIINPYSGRELDGKYPDLETVVECARKNSIRVKLDIARLKAACALCLKGFYGFVSISFTDVAGRPVRVGMRGEYLKAIIHGLEAYGIEYASFDAERPEEKAILFECPDASFVLMPSMLGGDYIDMSGTLSMTDKTREQIEAWKEAAEMVANEIPETPGAVRKVKAAAKRAAAYRGLLEAADSGLWMAGAAAAKAETVEAVEPVKVEAVEPVNVPEAVEPVRVNETPEAEPETVDETPEAVQSETESKAEPLEDAPEYVEVEIPEKVDEPEAVQAVKVEPETVETPEDTAGAETVPEPVKAARKHVRGYEARNGRNLMALEAVAAADGRFGVFVRKPGNTIYKAVFKDAAGAECAKYAGVWLNNQKAAERDYRKAGDVYAGADIQIREERRGVVYERIYTASGPEPRRRGLWGRVRAWVSRVAAFAGVVSVVSGN